MEDEVLDLAPSGGFSPAEQPSGTAVSHSPFPLEAPERSVTIRDRGRELVHVFAPVTAEDWIEFERLTRLVMESEGDRVRSNSLEAEATDWLWNERIIRIEGYPEPKPENWKQKIWLRHKQAAIAALTQIFEWEDAPVDLYAEGEITVHIEAACNGQRYLGLRHVFREPQTKHQVDWSRSNSAVTSIRGNRGGVAKHLISSNLRFQLKLYDELIVKVEGYQPDDPKVMDPLHKKVAIAALMGNG